jgi:hypothetical protein
LFKLKEYILKHYLKISALSLAVLTGISMESRADIGEQIETCRADGSYTLKHTAQDNKESSPMSEYAITGLKVASMPVESIARYTIAYNASYYGVEFLKEATALSLYGLTYLTLGSRAADGVYCGVQVGFSLLNWFMPNSDAVIAGAYTPLVKPVTDKFIDNAPTILGTLYSGTSSLLSGTASLAGSLYSWYTAEEEPANNFNFSGSYIEAMFS